MNVEQFEAELKAIAKLSKINRIEADQKLNEFIQRAKKNNYSAKCCRYTYNTFVSGLNDTERLTKAALAVVGGTSMGDRPGGGEGHAGEGHAGEGPADDKPRSGNGRTTWDPSTDSFDVETVKRDWTCEQIRKRLGAANMVFSYGSSMVVIEEAQVIRLWQDHEHKIPFRTARPMTLTRERAIGKIEKIANFHMIMKETGNLVPKPTPGWASDLIAGGNPGHFPPLSGMLRHPALTADNTLIHGCIGYDPETQYWIDAPLNGADPGTHTWENPQAALDFLVYDWLGEFCFASDADRYRAVMLCLTLLKSRTALAIVGQKWPAFMVTAPMPGVGKSELVEAISIAITGGRLPFAAFPHANEEEMNKTLIPLGLADPSGFCFDNVQNGSALVSANLDQFIASDAYTGRILGVNRFDTVPSLAVIIATGNNIRAVEDSATRWLEIRLQPDTDTPQNKVYGRDDIREWTRDHRGQILSALTTIAETEHELPPAARFKAWHTKVAGPVMTASGDATLLDAWKESGVTNASSEEYGALLDRLADVQNSHMRERSTGILFAKDSPEVADELLDLTGRSRMLPVEGLWASEVAERCPEALSDLIDKASDLCSQDLAKRAATQKVVVKNLEKWLREWNGKVQGKVRLRIDKANNSAMKGKLRTRFSAVLATSK